MHVHKCKNHPYLIANVKDQKGNKINHGMATIVIKDGDRVVPVTSAVIKNGFMHAPLDEGTFYVFSRVTISGPNGMTMPRKLKMQPVLK